MPRPLLLFDAFVPSGDVEARETCVTFIPTFAEKGGVKIPVLLSDIGRAERGIEADPSTLDSLLSENPERVRIAHSACNPQATRALLERLLREQDLAIELVTLDGTRPDDVPASDRLVVARPADLEPVVLEHYGPLEREMLSNGVVWHDEPTPICQRPQRVSVAEHGPEALLGTLERHLAACEAAFPEGVPTRALELTIDGTLAFEDRVSLDRLLDVAAVRGVLLRRIRYRGGGSLAGLVTALRETVRQTLRGASVVLDIEPSEDPAIDAARTILGKDPLDPDRLNELQRSWAAHSPQREDVRHADDLLRRAVFRSITDSAHSPETSERAAALLGAPRLWIDAYRRFSNRGAPRVVVVPTWQCELRCTYCTIPKQDGRVMTPRTLERAIELLLSSESSELELHFFGGEPFLEWPLIQHACEWGSARAASVGSKITFLFTTNAFSLTREMVDWLSKYEVRFQLSVDGDAATQNAFRRTLTPGLDSYQRSPANNAGWFRDAKVAHDVIQVVHPRNAEHMDDNFTHLADMGYETIQVNFALGTRWSRDAVSLFAEGLHRIGLELERRWDAGAQLELVNLRETVKRVRTNVEVTVDHDGHVFGSNAFLYIPKYRDEFLLGHLDDLRSFDRYSIDGLSGDDLLRHWYKDGMAENNQQVGAVVTSFVRWMRGRHPERYGDVAAEGVAR